MQNGEPFQDRRHRSMLPTPAAAYLFEYDEKCILLSPHHRMSSSKDKERCVSSMYKARYDIGHRRYFSSNRVRSMANARCPRADKALHLVRIIYQIIIRLLPIPGHEFVLRLAVPVVHGHIICCRDLSQAIHPTLLYPADMLQKAPFREATASRSNYIRA